MGVNYIVFLTKKVILIFKFEILLIKLLGWTKNQNTVSSSYERKST